MIIHGPARCCAATIRFRHLQGWASLIFYYKCRLPEALTLRRMVQRLPDIDGENHRKGNLKIIRYSGIGVGNIPGDYLGESSNKPEQKLSGRKKQYRWRVAFDTYGFSDFS